MSISSTDYEKLGQFYLGRGYDPEAKKVDVRVKGLLAMR